jgi:hypothetical protein
MRHGLKHGIALIAAAVFGYTSACSPDATSAPRTLQDPIGNAGQAAFGAGSAAVSGGPSGPLSNGLAGSPAIAGSNALPIAAGRGAAGIAVPNAGVGVPVAGMVALPRAGSPAAGSSALGAGGATAPPAGMGDPKACPPAPAGASNEAVQALMAVNTSRVAAGSGCMNMVAALNTSALSHCMYNANSSNLSNSMCMAGGHTEAMSCMGFTGADVAAREKAAGYSAIGATEVLTSYGNMPVQAVPSWINTVWHRIPMLDPWTVDMGYGGAKGCDVIDFGRGTPSAASSSVVVYPYDGQTGVPPSFSGRESPVPPAPSGGWPSSYPINIYAQKIMITEHVLTKDGDSTPLPHTWMDAQSSTVDPGYKYYLTSTSFMYGDKPFAPNTKYRVKMVGTHTGGAINLEWTFTTGAANPFGP